MQKLSTRKSHRVPSRCAPADDTPLKTASVCPADSLRAMLHRLVARGRTDVAHRRSQQLRRVPYDRLPSMLEYRERLGDFGNRLFGALGIDDDNVSRAADGKAIVGKIEQPR